MAASTAWRKLLNDHPIFEVLRSSKNDLKKSKDCRGLIEVINGELYLWNAYNSSLLTTNLKCLGLKESQADRVSHQMFLCSNPPVFDVDWLTFSHTGHFVALSGHRGVSVLQIPQRTGKYAEFDNGKKKVSCKTISVAERLFVSNSKVRLLHAAWHPGSRSDSHLVLLTSDNVIRIYDISRPHDPIQTYLLSDPANNYSRSAFCSTFNLALGESAVSFDIGQKVSLEAKCRPGIEKKLQSGLVWPLYVLWGNGDIYLLYTSLETMSPVKPRVIGPLTMCPPAEDNYGTDACSVKCLESSPSVLVISTRSGKLYHCVILPSPSEQCDETDPAWNSCDTSVYDTPLPISLYVFESIELELSLTTVSVDSDEVVPDDFTCPIRLHKDPSAADRYHCSHSAGVHSIVIPWVYRFQQYVRDEEVDLPDASSQDNETIVEHLICTKPLPTSAPSPVLGVALTDHKLLGHALLCLTSMLECITIPLLTQPRLMTPQLLSSSPTRNIESPLKQLQREPFDQHIRKILRKNASNPLLRGATNTDLPAQELFQLLSRSTQVFREERIQKLDLARQEIERRVRILTERKEHQLTDLAESEQMRNILTSNAESLAEKFEDISDKQERLIDRLDTVLRKLQLRCGELSVAERGMRRDLLDMEVNLKQRKNTLEQLQVKEAYQSKQLAQRRQQNQGKTGSSGTPISLNKGQSENLKTLLKQEGDQITDLVRQLNDMKLQL